MLRLFVSMPSKCLPLVAKVNKVSWRGAAVVDVEDGDFLLEAGVRDAQPSGAARDDDLEPGLRPLFRDEEADAASVAGGHVVGDPDRVERLARVLGRVGQGNEVVN
eukprot:3414743-Pyramimonas_sp.AAC.1